MAENDKYPDNEHGTFAPVGFLLVVAIAVVLGIFVFARSQGPGVPETAPAGGPAPANPTAPVVPGTAIPASPNAPG